MLNGRDLLFRFTPDPRYALWRHMGPPGLVKAGHGLAPGREQRRIGHRKVARRIRLSEPCDLLEEFPIPLLHKPCNLTAQQRIERFRVASPS